MTIVVTGSDSFLAYHLISALIKKGHRVLGCDLKKGRNTQHLLELYQDFSFFECDITDLDQLKNTLKQADFIYHLAAVSSERFCRENIINSFEVNVKGVLNLLIAARQVKAAFIFASSGSVYADSLKVKREEEAGFGGKFYGTSKLVAEEYCRLFNKNFGVPSVILRFSRLYGPRMERNPVYDITKGLVNREKILLYEGLESNYDFIYVEDAVEALAGALDSKWLNDVFNISSARGVKLKELLALYFKVAGFEVPVEVKRDVSQTDILDNAKAAGLGFRPKVQLEEGLRQTFLYFSKAGVLV